MANIIQQLNTPTLVIAHNKTLAAQDVYKRQMFNPTKDKYYALILLRMNARSYTLVNYGYAIVKLMAAYLLFGFLAGGLVRCV